MTGNVWWQNEFSPEVEKISLTSLFKFYGSDIEGASELQLPMVRGFETNKADIIYRMKEVFRELR